MKNVRILRYKWWRLYYCFVAYLQDKFIDCMLRLMSYQLTTDTFNLLRMIGVNPGISHSPCSNRQALDTMKIDFSNCEPWIVWRLKKTTSTCRVFTKFWHSRLDRPLFKCRSLWTQGQINKYCFQRSRFQQTNFNSSSYSVGSQINLTNIRNPKLWGVKLSVAMEKKHCFTVIIERATSILWSDHASFWD